MRSRWSARGASTSDKQSSLPAPAGAKLDETTTAGAGKVDLSKIVEAATANGAAAAAAASNGDVAAANGTADANQPAEAPAPTVAVDGKAADAAKAADTSKPTVAALLKQPNQKSYLPRFGAPEAYGKRRNTSDFTQTKKDVEERLARKAAAEAKARLKKKPKPTIEIEDQGMDDEEKEAWISLIFTATIGVLIALTEAIDIEILLGFLFMPFMATMKWFARTLDNEALDPSLWIGKVKDGYTNFAKDHPEGFVFVDFSLFAIIVVYILFADDLSRWWATRGLRAQGYDELSEEADEVRGEHSLLPAASRRQRSLDCCPPGTGC